jgi:hypothetical protein
MDAVDSIREELSKHTIHFDKLEDDTGIFDQVDAFVDLTRENETVEEVVLCLATDPDAPAGMPSGTKLLKALEIIRRSV